MIIHVHSVNSTYKTLFTFSSQEFTLVKYEPHSPNGVSNPTYDDTNDVKIDVREKRDVDNTDNAPNDVIETGEGKYDVIPTDEAQQNVTESPREDYNINTEDKQS